MISLDKLKESLLVKISEEEIIKRLSLVSQTFTINRDRIKDVYSDPKNISSYAYFYLPTNMHKMEYLINHLSKSIIEDIRDSIVIDVGCGPGTYIFSLIELIDMSKASFFGIDHNFNMLDQAKKIHQSTYPCSDIEWRNDIPNLKGKKTLIFGNSINEMGHNEALRLIHRTDPQLIILIEPGTKDSFSEVKKLRTQLCKTHFTPVFPCPSKLACPMGEDNWCHQVIKVSLDKDLERIGQRIKKDRTKMPAVIHVYRNEASEENVSRVIRLEKKAKHAFYWNVCEKGNDSNNFFRLEVLKKPLAKKMIKSIEKLSTGFRISYKIQKEISETHKKVLLTKVNDDEVE